MAFSDSVGQQREWPTLAGGKGMALFYEFFEDQLDPAAAFIDIVFEPGAYAGYHRHEGHDSVLYVLSGKAENYQEGERYIVEAGAAMLTKSGQAHAVRNVGDGDLHLLEFNAAVGGQERSGTLLPLPEEISDWE
jgi:quercetin dioxygenase-like cupin family protein